MIEQSLPRTTALVTGASRGIGAAIAFQLAERGLRLILVARGQDSLDQLAASLPEAAAVDTLTVDLSESDGAFRLLQLVNDREIDILINNAGGAPNQSSMETDADQVQRLIQLNVTAPTQLMHGLIPSMKARRRGRILNVASMGAFHPVPGSPSTVQLKLTFCF